MGSWIISHPVYAVLRGSCSLERKLLNPDSVATRESGERLPSPISESREGGRGHENLPLSQLSGKSTFPPQVTPLDEKSLLLVSLLE